MAIGDFVHGVRFIELSADIVPVEAIRSAVWGMIGTAPIHKLDPENQTINQPVLVATDRDAVKYFGTATPGYSLPYDLDAWKDHGAGVCVVINVFDSVTMLNVDPGSPRSFDDNDEIDLTGVNIDIISVSGTAAYAAYQSFDGSDEIQLPNKVGEFAFESDQIDLGYVNAAVVSVVSLIDESLYALGADYTVSNGVISRVGAGAIAADETVRVTYSFLAVTALKNLAGATYTAGTDYTTAGGLITRLGGAIAAGEMVRIFYEEANFTFLEGRDYEVDPVVGKIKRSTNALSSRIAPGATVTVAYEYPDAPTEAQIIGQTTLDGQRTGMQAFLETFSKYGFQPMILTATENSHKEAVARELEIIAEKLSAVALIDAPAGATRNQAIEGRGDAGPVQAFATSNGRAYLCYLQAEIFDIALNAHRLEPLSRRAAALICRTDIDRGYWHSPSNQVLRGVTGMEAPLAQQDRDLLNSRGINTIFKEWGAGYRLWGNRTAGYPNTADIRTFLPVRRTLDILHLSVKLAVQNYVDRPITEVALHVPGLVNAFIAELKADGALVGGVCEYERAKNPATQLAKGTIVFSLRATPPPPAEQIIFESTVDIQYLDRVGQVVGSSQSTLQAA